jgi:hypothetical protein
MVNMSAAMEFIKKRRFSIMGYTATFDGHISVDPPLSLEEIAYLDQFANTRRMACEQGPYYVDRGSLRGQDRDDPGILDFNTPPDGQPGLWCQWIPTEDGMAIEWDGGEKFYEAEEWVQYLIDHFVGSAPRGKAMLPFLQGHTLNGEIYACGEDDDDRWKLIVQDNRVFVAEGYIAYGEPRPI